MALGTKDMGGLLVVGAVLTIAAITIRAGFRDETAQVDAAAQSEGKGDMFGTKGTNRGAVDHADDASFQEKVLNYEGRVLVDFYADWCGPCRMLTPLLEELAQELPDARIVKVNVDHAPNLARHYGIQSIPALIAFDNGQQVDQHVGVASKSELRGMLGH